MRLDDRLIEEKTTDGGIDFHDHISRVREEAPSWLEGIEKNGIEHSGRLEGYLDRLIPDEFKEKLKPAEVFILLYAVYLHDIGYRNEQGEIESKDHPLRSREYIRGSCKALLPRSGVVRPRRSTRLPSRCPAGTGEQKAERKTQAS